MSEDTPKYGTAPLHVPAGADWRENSSLYPEWMVNEFIGWLTGDFPEIDAIGTRRLLDSWERFKAVHAGRNGFAPNGEG